jgi:hypothetical protein
VQPVIVDAEVVPDFVQHRLADLLAHFVVVVADSLDVFLTASQAPGPLPCGPAPLAVAR